MNFQGIDISAIIEPHCYLVLHAMHVDESILGLEDISCELLDGREVLVVDAIGADEPGR